MIRPTKRTSRLGLLCIVLGLSIVPAAAVDYFVDFEHGDDLAAGLSPASAWQHAPGDVQATNAPAAIELQPGDRVLFKGDVVYRGQITVPASGTEQQPIVFQGNAWPGLEAVRARIDGSELLTGWAPCGSAAECGDSVYWQDLVFSFLPGSISAFIANLHEIDPLTLEDEFLWVAQEPNPMDPYFFDDRDDFWPISQDHLTLTSITHATVFNQADPDAWNDAFVQIWINPNIVVLREILQFEPAENRISFDPLPDNALYSDGRDHAFCLYNAIQALDQPGEFFVRHTPEPDGTRRVILWPRAEDDLDDRISYASRRFGIDINSQDFVHVSGFVVTKHSGEGLTDGVGIGTVTAAYLDNQGVQICDNHIRHNRAISGGYGGIYLSGAMNSSLESNTVESNPKHRGIFCPGAVNVTIRNNTIERSGSTSLTLYEGYQSRIIANTIRGSHGSHANGITLYMGCDYILVADNVVQDCSSPVTFQDSGNLFFVNNIIDGNGELSNVNEWGDTSHGPWSRGVIAFFNNVMIHNSRNASLNIGDVDGIVVATDFRSILNNPDHRLQVLTNLYHNGYTVRGVIQDAFAQLMDESDFVLNTGVPEIDDQRSDIFSILKKQQEQNHYVVRNNVLDGSGTVIQVFDEATQTEMYMENPCMDYDYNLYTGLLWNQSASYQWTPGAHEILDFVDQEEAIFTAHQDLDFTIFPGSPAMDAGTDVSALWDTWGLDTLFPDFHPIRDVVGHARPQGPSWDTGIWEYPSNFFTSLDQWRVGTLCTTFQPTILEFTAFTNRGFACP